MHLLTWHGTLVCLARANGELAHQRLPWDDQTYLPLIVNPTAKAAHETIIHPTIGAILVIPAEAGMGYLLWREGSHIHPQLENGAMVLSNDSISICDVFLGVENRDLLDIGYILEHRWILSHTRQVILRKDIRLEEGFKLRIGGHILDLRESIAKLVSNRSAAGDPSRLRVMIQETEIEMILAGASGSDLLDGSKFMNQSWQTAKVLAIAAHRHFRGYEPAQDDFERDTSFLYDSGGAVGLEDLLETLQSGPPSNCTDNDRMPAISFGEHLASPMLECAVVALGTSCIVACALRKVDAGMAPMPFDWLTTNPSMIRHCLDDGFEKLLDKSYYISLTGQQKPGEPEEGCDHIFYKESFGINRLFNHSDPTSVAHHRYATVCAERLRDLLHSDQPKLFVQCSHASAESAAEFEATTSLIDKLTRNAMLLQLEVAAPDRRLAIPLLSTIARKGRHQLSKVHPSSKMGGEFFEAEVDNSFLQWVIAAHAHCSAIYSAKLNAYRQDLRLAMHQYDQGLPTPEGMDDTLLNANTMKWANSILTQFCKNAGLQSHFSYRSYDRSTSTHKLNDNLCVGEIQNNNVVLSFPFDQPMSRTILHRSLTIVYLLDQMLVAGPIEDSNFFFDVGDHSSTDCISFCNNIDGGCLVPDSDFMSSAGYIETRNLVKSKGMEWSSRRPVAFWRGATTGHRTKPPPRCGSTDDFSWLPRLEMCRRLIDSEAAEHCDVGITDIVQIDEEDVRASIRASGLCKAREGREAFMLNKLILVIDGNANAWSALFCALLTGSCVLLVESPHNFKQWYYHSLTPWKHYVPVSARLDNLEERISWALGNDHEAETIAAAGRGFAEGLTFEAAVEDATVRLREWLSTPKQAVLADPLAYSRRRPAGEAGTVTGHIQGRGDFVSGIEDWIGVPGSGRWIEGIKISLNATEPRNAFFYQVVTKHGDLSVPGTAGSYLGTRGENKPIYGFAISAEDNLRNWDIEYEAYFVGGTHVGPVRPGQACTASSGAPMEAFRISIVPRYG